MKKINNLADRDPETFPDRRIKLVIDNMGDKHSIALHPWVWLLIVAVLLCGLIILGVFAFQGGGADQSQKLKKYSVENDYLREKLQNIEADLDSIKVKIDGGGAQSDTSKGVYPYYGSEDWEGRNHLQVHPGLQEQLETIELKVAELKDLLGFEGEFDLPEFALPAGFSTQGDGIPSIYPTFGEISDGWGMRLSPFTNEPEFHTGLDIANKIGTAVYATADGIVTKSHFESGFGKVIIVMHTDGYQTLYGHLYTLKVKVGDAVHKGQIIALIGNTGMSTGPHLHYQISRDGEAINPSAYLNRLDGASVANL